MTNVQKYELFFFANLAFEKWVEKEEYWAKNMIPSDNVQYWYERAVQGLERVLLDELEAPEDALVDVLNTIVYWARRFATGKALFLTSTFNGWIRDGLLDWGVQF